jgi:hypothetical protein
MTGPSAYRLRLGTRRYSPYSHWRTHELAASSPCPRRRSWAQRKRCASQRRYRRCRNTTARTPSSRPTTEAATSFIHEHCLVDRVATARFWYADCRCLHVAGWSIVSLRSPPWGDSRRRRSQGEAQSDVSRSLTACTKEPDAKGEPHLGTLPASMAEIPSQKSPALVDVIELEPRVDRRPGEPPTAHASGSAVNVLCRERAELVAA